MFALILGTCLVVVGVALASGSWAMAVFLKNDNVYALAMIGMVVGAVIDTMGLLVLGLALVAMLFMPGWHMWPMMGW